MKMKCKSCKRVVDNVNIGGRCPFCGGKSFFTLEEMEASRGRNSAIDAALNRFKVAFDENHAKKEKIFLYGIGAIAVVIIIFSSYIIHSTKKAITVKTYENEIEELIDSGDYKAANTKVDELSNIANSNNALNVAEDYKRQLTEDCLERAETLAKKGDYDGAIKELRQIHNPDENIDALILFYTEQSIDQKLNELDAAGDTTAAIKLLNEEMAKSDEIKDEYGSLYETYTSNYRELLFERAEEAYENGVYTDAVDLLMNEGFSVLGKEDAPLLEKISYYKDFRPVSLADLTPYKGNMLESCTITDAFGNSHSNALCNEWGYSYDFDNFYRIEGKYSKLEMTLVVDSDYKNMPNDTGLHIYCDGSEVYTYISGEEDIEPVSIVVPLDGVQDLEIKLERDRNWGRHMIPVDMVLCP